MSDTNGQTTTNRNRLPPFPQEMDARQVDRFEEMVANVWQSRNEFFSRYFGPRNNLFEECNYPDVVLANFYRDMYDRFGIAERVVQLMPKECWQVTPMVYEDEDSENVTEFEQAWDELAKSIVNVGDKSWHQDEEGSLIWNYLLRADILSRISTFGIIMLGLDDGKLLEQPAAGVSPDGAPKDISGISEMQSKDIYGGVIPQRLEFPFAASTMGTDAQYFQTQFSPMAPDTKGVDSKVPKGAKKPKLLFLRVFDESLVQVVQYESSIYSPRFGQPIMYQVTMNDPRQPHTGIGLPLATVRVHWSRVIHVAEVTDMPSEIFAKPAMRPVLNNLLDLRKIYGASGEGFWKQAFAGLSLETHPQLGGDVIVDQNAVSDMMGNYYANLKRWLLLTGMSAKTLAPAVTDPTSQVQVQIEAICIELGCPVRVFKGSERGELASTQDDSSWNDRIRHRQKTYITPRIIVPFIDRLIALGILPEPKEGLADPDPVDVSKLVKGMMTAPPTAKPGAGASPADKPPPGAPPSPGGNPPIPGASGGSPKLPQPGKPGAMVGNSPNDGEDDPQAQGPQDGYDEDSSTEGADLDSYGYSDDPEPAADGKPDKDGRTKVRSGYSVEWPDLDSNTDKDKAGIALTTTQALAAYVQGGIENLIPPMDFLTRILGMDEEEAREIIVAALKVHEEEQDKNAELADEHGFEPTPPPGFKDVPPPPPPLPGMPGGPPQSPIKVKEGETLVHPATVKPPPDQAEPTGNTDQDAAKTFHYMTSVFEEDNRR